MALSADGQSTCARELFRVARSTNANVVLYEANTGPSGTLDAAEPVRATWMMLAEDGRREELTGLERSLAYGLDVRETTTLEGALVALKAEPSRPLSIRMENGCLVAIATIRGREAVLREVFVKVGGGIFPSVRSVELVGMDLETGVELREAIPAGL